EVVNQHILDADTLSVTAGGVTTTDDDYVFDGQTRSSTLLGLGVILDYPSIFTGWDLSLNATWQQNLDGSAYQGLGRDEKTLTLGRTSATWATSRSAPPGSTTCHRRMS